MAIFSDMTTIKHAIMLPAAVAIGIGTLVATPAASAMPLSASYSGVECAIPPGGGWQSGCAPTPSNGYLGWSVAVSGTVAVVGAPGARGDRGWVYIYAHSGRTWHLQAILTDPDSVSSDEFGSSVAVSGSTAVIGAYGVANNNGAAYVYVRSGTSWSLQAELTDPGAVSDQRFGSVVAVSGSTAVIGADTLGSSRVMAYVYTRSGTTWHQQAKLASPGTDSGSWGNFLSFSGATVVVGAPDADKERGVVYIYARSGTAWHRQARLVGPVGTAGEGFGYSAAVSGKTLVIGTEGVAHAIKFVYVYERSEATWHRQARLADPEHRYKNDGYGEAVAISGSRILASAPYWSQRSCGTAFEFTRSGIVWSERAEVVNPGCETGDWFGMSVTISGTTAVIGAPLKNKNRGAVYQLTLR